MTLDQANFVLLTAIGILFVALIFARHLHAFIVRLQLMNSRSAGIRVYNLKNFRDTSTGEFFQVWQGVSGIRLALISLLVKF